MPYLPHQEPDRFRFRWNSLAVTRYDVCLIGVTCDYLLVAWRFEDA